MLSKKIFEAYGRCIVKRPWTVIGISLLFILISLYGMSMVYMEAGEEGILDENTEEYKNYKKYTDNFGGTQKLFILVTAEDVTRLNILQAMDSLERNLNRSEYVTNVMSISTIMKMAMFEYSGMEMLPNNQTMVDMVFSSLPKDTIANLVPDEKHALVVVDITDDIDEGIDAVASSLEETEFPDDMKTKVVGEAIYYHDLTGEMEKDMAITMGAAIVLMIVILWLIFGHVKLRLLPFLIVLVGVLWTLGLMGFANIPITILVMTVFPILIGLGIDYSINFQNRAHEEFENETPEKAIIETTKHVGSAIGIALITTCLGFGTLLISVMPMVRNFGLMCVFGVILCYVSAFSLLPAILFLYQRRKIDRKKETKEKKKTQIPKKNRVEKIFYTVSEKTSKHPWPIFSIAIILALGGLIAGSYLEVIVDFEDLAPEDMEAIQDLNELRDMIGGTEEFIIMVEADNITDVSLMEWMRNIEELEVNKHEGITEATSIASYIKNINNNTLPPNNETLFFIINRIPERIRKGLINGDYNLAVIKLKIQHLSNEEKEDIYNALMKDVESHPAGTDVCVTGAPVIILKTSDALTGNRDTLTIVGCILIFTGLIVIYRRPIKAFIPVVPILLVIGWSMGLMYILGISLNPLTVCLGALIIGLGADYTIHIMERYDEERDKGKDPTNAIQVATSKIGRAIFSSGLTTMGGFGVLMAASFPFIREFGFVIVMDVALCLLSSLIVLPPLIVIIDKWEIKRAEKKGAN